MPEDPKADGIAFHHGGVLRYKPGRSLLQLLREDTPLEQCRLAGGLVGSRLAGPPDDDVDRSRWTSLL